MKKYCSNRKLADARPCYSISSLITSEIWQRLTVNIIVNSSNSSAMSSTNRASAVLFKKKDQFKVNFKVHISRRTIVNIWSSWHTLTVDTCMRHKAKAKDGFQAYAITLVSVKGTFTSYSSLWLAALPSYDIQETDVVLKH
uniref:Uncharacterized protein n=1 Tax=Glossina austeni TaxID=7395 RepID=A0A1A9USH1_GLOAU